MPESLDLDFSNLNLKKNLTRNLETLGYKEMTEIQSKCIPMILTGQDIIAQSKTGSGKTITFGLGILNLLDETLISTQALIICPTRELAYQVTEQLQKLSRTIPNIKISTLCGGIPIKAQMKSLTHQPHILIGTPGRIEHHLREQSLSLSDINILVLDEADILLEMGFEKNLTEIIKYCPSSRQTMLFSATYNDNVETKLSSIMNDPIKVETTDYDTSAHIQQLFYSIDSNIAKSVYQLSLEHDHTSCIVFCNTKNHSHELSKHLNQMGLSTAHLHGDLEHKQRQTILTMFANTSISLLIATDIAARGLDISDVELIINADIPNSLDTYIHRIGRTGRAHCTGVACTLVGEQDKKLLTEISNFYKKEFPLQVVSNSKNSIQNKNQIVTIEINGGKKQKIRPGDILGALTRNNVTASTDIGKITIFHSRSLVAINKNAINKVLDTLNHHTIKGKKHKAKLITSLL
jgi:ATP-dependent RNA helicase DbpA